MKPLLRWSGLLCVAMASSAVQPAERTAPPAPYCVHARDIVETRQSDPRTFAIRLNDQSSYRVELVDACPGATRGNRLQLVSSEGWLCGGNNETIHVDNRTCHVSGMARIDAREFAGHALAEHRGEDAGDLDTIVITGKRRRGFGGTTAYCFDTRHLRGWRDDGGDLIVEVSPRRSGGNRMYQVELGSSCSELTTAMQARFVSGVGLNVICGNAGDRVLLDRDDPEPMVGGGFLRRRAESGLAAQSGCPISRVYPLLPDEVVASE